MYNYGLLPLPLLALLVVVAAVADGRQHERPKRFLSFQKGSTFFYRLNYKVTTLPYTTLVAHASGFKVNWELPTRGQPRRQARSSASPDDFRNAAEMLLSSHGFDGKVCLLKSLCQATEYIENKNGVLMKLLGLLFGSHNASTGNNTERRQQQALPPLICQNYANHCPLHLIKFDAFAAGL